MGRRGPRVVALGDSITLGVGDHERGDVPCGWAAHVAHCLGASSFVNLAANGTRARTLAATQLPRALVELPDIVLMTVGGNDVLRGDFQADEVRDRVADVIARLERPGRVILLLTIDRVRLFAVLGKRVDAVMARRVRQLNQALLDAVAGTSVTVLDGAAVFASAGSDAWHVDRIHPSARGHRVLAAAALEALAGSHPQIAPIPQAGPSPHLPARLWWLLRQGLPWVAKRSRDLIPQVATVVAHELIVERRLHSHPLAK